MTSATWPADERSTVRALAKRYMRDAMLVHSGLDLSVRFPSIEIFFLQNKFNFFS